MKLLLSVLFYIYIYISLHLYILSFLPLWGNGVFIIRHVEIHLFSEHGVVPSHHLIRLYLKQVLCKQSTLRLRGNARFTVNVCIARAFHFIYITSKSNDHIQSSIWGEITLGIICGRKSFRIEYHLTMIIYMRQHCVLKDNVVIAFQNFDDILVVNQQIKYLPVNTSKSFYFVCQWHSQVIRYIFMTRA